VSLEEEEAELNRTEGQAGRLNRQQACHKISENRQALGVQIGVKTTGAGNITQGGGDDHFLSSNRSDLEGNISTGGGVAGSAPLKDKIGFPQTFSPVSSGSISDEQRGKHKNVLLLSVTEQGIIQPKGSSRNFCKGERCLASCSMQCSTVSARNLRQTRGSSTSTKISFAAAERK